MSEFTTELDVVGLGFRVKKDAREALARIIDKEGSIQGIQFEREPDNKHDDMAIKVLLPERMQDGLHIGYMRASAAARLAPLLDAGSIEFVQAALTSLDAEDGFKEGSMLVEIRDNRTSGKGAKAAPKPKR